MSTTLLRPIRPGLWLTEVELPGFRVRGAVMVGARRALVWDTLSRPRDMEPVRPLVEGRPIVVVYSHADWDHAWGTAGLPEVAEVVAHRIAVERLLAEGPLELAEKRAEDPSHFEEVVIVSPTLTFESRHHVDLGGLGLELCHLPGHTADSIVGLIPGLGVLLAGDAVESPLPLLNPGSDLDGWVRRLEAWAKDPRVELVVPAHGEPGGPELLEGTARYLRGLQAGVTESPDSGLDAFYREAHQRNLELV